MSPATPSRSSDRPSLVGAVLVGGRSSRMGQDKAGLRLPDGRTFAAAIAEVLSARCEAVVTVGGQPGPERGLPGEMRHVDDLARARGPLAGVAGLLSSGAGDRYLLASCDAPLLLPADLGPLLGPPPVEPGAAYVGPDGRLQPLPCRLDASLADLAVERARGDDRSLQGFLRAASVRALPADEERLARLRGVNTPEELAALKARFA